MGASVTNRLIISGNEQVHNFVKALNEQFIEDYKINGFQNNSSVRRIIYGHPPEIAERLSKSQDTKGVHFIDDTKWRPIETTISLISWGGDAKELQDYLLAIFSLSFIMKLNSKYRFFLAHQSHQPRHLREFRDHLQRCPPGQRPAHYWLPQFWNAHQLL